MEKIKIIKDITGGTLTIWFDDPGKEYICEETGDGVILMKTKEGKVIGAEFLYYSNTNEAFSIETLVNKRAI